MVRGSFGTLDVFLKHGANIFQTEYTHNWNIIHFLVFLSNEEKSFEHKAVMIFGKLKVLLGHDVMHQILRMEDKEGLRPVELSVHASCFLLFDAIFNYAFVSKTEDIGLKQIIWYDVTEYEGYEFNCSNKSRYTKSLLKLLTYCDASALNNSDAKKLLRGDYWKSWADLKFRCNRMFILTWMFLRILSLCFFCIVMTTNNMQMYYSFCHMFGQDKMEVCSGNFTAMTNISLASAGGYWTGDCVPFTGWYLSFDHEAHPDVFDDNHLVTFALALVFAGYVQVYSLTSLLFDVVATVARICMKTHNWRSFCGNKKNIAVGSRFYTVGAVVFSLTSLVYLTFLQFPILLLVVPGNFRVGLLTIACLASLTPIMYFLSACPGIGHLVIGVRKMLSTMITFWLMFVVLFAPFPHVFLVILKDDFANCEVENFENSFNGNYATFKIMLNMLDPAANKDNKGKYFYFTF